MPKLPGTIRIHPAQDDTFRFEIDGKEFPYYIAADPIEVLLDPDGPSSVTITLYADRVVTD